MKLTYLKKFRVVVSLLFFLPIVFLFIDYSGIIPIGIIDGLLYLQFIPSVLNFAEVLKLSAIGFVIILILSLLFGRIYCSSICPLGTLQDIISFMGIKFKGKKFRYQYRKPSNILHYSVLLLTVIVLLTGNLLLLNLLDPYSNFGRILTNLVKPGYIGINNLLSLLLESFRNYSIPTVEIYHYSLFAIAYSIVILLFTGYLAFTKGRLYCNTVCPVGALLAIISKISFYKITINDNCTSCGLCSRKCKASCIDSKNSQIDYSRCVNCFNCLNACKVNGLDYKISKSNFLKPQESEVVETDTGKRKFIAGAIVYLIGMSGFVQAQKSKLKIKPTKLNTVPVIRKTTVAPPGSLNVEHFKSHCTACHLCVSKCPTQVLQPSFLEYGLLGVMQPFMDFRTNFCNHSCTICSDVCPNGAILPLAVEDKKVCQIGKVIFIKENCIVVTNKTDCGACSEHCPTKAVKMVPYEGKLFIPVTEQEICVGCGACEFVCPSIPYKSIYIEGNSVQLVARKPKIEKLDQKENKQLEDFPF